MAYIISRERLRGWFTGAGRVTQSEYLFTGALLFTLKFAIDWTIARIFGVRWTPVDYFVWPARQTTSLLDLPSQEREFGFVMLAVAMPFIWIGVSMTLRRLRDAQIALPCVLLFFVPVVNVLLILMLCLFPTETAPHVVAPPPDQPRRRVLTSEDTKQFLAASASSALLVYVLMHASVLLLSTYALTLFVGAPFFQGWLAAILFAWRQRRSVTQCVSVGWFSLLISGVIMVLTGFEGLVCIVMAIPLLLPMTAIGASAGASMPTIILTILAIMPALTAAEALSEPVPRVRELRTEVIINAPIETVWRTVIDFPPLAKPTELLFRAGIAYPIRAELHGRGVGAVRHCVFSTGPFVEPIEIWDEPHCLAFRVTEQPHPMEELSPYDIHPPHLDNFLVSRRGEFRLEVLPDGRTKLVGATWYTNRMWPEIYWALWSDYIIHRIHWRVLDHVRTVAEARK